MKKRTYRLTGFLYLLIIICAGFSQGYIRGSIVVPEDALATANNIIQNEALFRFGNFSLPGYEDYTALIVGVAAAIGELSFTFYLLIKGKKQPYGEETKTTACPVLTGNI